MWNGTGEDYNDNGQTVRLYHPITYGRKPAQDDLTASYVGGGGSGSGGDPTSSSSSSSLKNNGGPPTCPSCHEPLYLLLQVFIPKTTTTLQVFACNRADCVNQLFVADGNGRRQQQQQQQQPLNYGGGDGVIVCRRKTVAVNRSNKSSTTTTKTEPDKTKPPVVSAWTEDHNAANDDDDDWGGCSDTMDTAHQQQLTDDIEAKLAALETADKVPSTNSKKKKETSVKNEENSKTKADTNSCCFPCYELHSLQEPPAARPTRENKSNKQQQTIMDDDDVGIEGSDDKISKMLAKYMEEEDDFEILNALRSTSAAGSHGNGGGWSGKSKERDERLSLEDRVLLTYSDRMKRSPRQVVRHAPGGVPLWSIPVTKPNNKQAPSKKSKAEPANKSIAAVEEKPIPPCKNCGSQRVFEIQLLSSLLHVLDVDKYSIEEESTTNSIGNIFSRGGMNWGNIAIYTCPKACDASQEEFVVVQAPIEGVGQLQEPSKPLHSYEPVVIAEGTDFSADIDVAEDEEEDDDDEDSEFDEVDCK